MSNFSLINARYKHRLFNKEVKSWTNTFKELGFFNHSMNVIDVGGDNGSLLLALHNNDFLEKGLIIDNGLSYVKDEYLNFYKKDDLFYKSKNIIRLDKNILEHKDSEVYDLLIKSYCPVNFNKVFSVFEKKPKYLLLSHENDLSKLMGYKLLAQFSNFPRKKDKNRYEKSLKDNPDMVFSYHYQLFEKIS